MMARLDEVNARLRTRNIKGKEYVEVNQRILGFWELHPDGCIVTTKLADDGDRCDFLAEVYVDGQVKATGHAYEVRTASNVNKTSYIENCETSAVGRALGMLGIGSTESIASAEEVEAAIAQQERAAKTAKKAAKPKDVAKPAGTENGALDGDTGSDSARKAAKGRLWNEIKTWCKAHDEDVDAYCADLFKDRPAEEWTALELDQMAAVLRSRMAAEPRGQR